MDIDIGKIDRIKIWHDNSGVGSAWFLDSIIIRKNYSTSQIISNIYIQRLQQVTQALHRQQLDKNSTIRPSSTNENERRRRSLKSKDIDDNGSYDHLGSSRGILRTPIMYDKSGSQKKVTWDEQSIGSQDDLFSIDSQRMKTIENISEQKHKKEESGHFDHHVYWISSHNYIDNKWKIKSIEEVNSFDFDQSIRSLLLSDRLPVNNKVTKSSPENDDEIYGFEASRWLAKDKDDGKLEVYLTSKLIHEPKHKSTVSSDTVIDSKKKHLVATNVRSDSQHQKYHDGKEAKHSAPYDLEPIGRSPRGLAPRDSPSSASHLSDRSKTPPNDPRSFQRNNDLSSRSIATSRRSEGSSRIDPSIDKFSLPSSYDQQLKSPRSTNDLATPLTSEQELLARISREPSHHSRSSANSLLPPSRLSKSPRSTNEFTESLTSERKSAGRMLNEPSNLPRSSATSLPPSNRLSKSSHNAHDRDSSLTSERELLARISHEPPYHPRSSATSLVSINQQLKSPHSARDLDSPLTGERESLAKISRVPSHHPRLPTTSLASSNQQLTSPHGARDLDSPLTSERESLARISRVPSHHPRLPTTSLASSNQQLTSPHGARDLDSPLTSERESLARISRVPSHHPRLPTTSLPSSNQQLQSSHSAHDLDSPLTSERESLAKISREPSNHLRSLTTPLSSSNSFSKSSRSNNDLSTPLANDQELLARISREPRYHSRSSVTSSLPPSRLSKSSRSVNDLTALPGERGSLARISDERPNLPQSAVSSLSSASPYSKPSRLNTESTSSLAKMSTGPVLNPKSSRSNLELSSKKSIYGKFDYFCIYFLFFNFVSDQVYNSAYGTMPSDDF
jgi:hypothetical protein